MIAKASYYGSPHIGIFCVANDSVALIPLGAPKKFEEQVAHALSVETVRASVSGSSLLGIFCVANNRKIIVPDILEKGEKKILRDNFGEIIILDERWGALGNLMAANDHGIAKSKYIQSGIGEELRIAGTDFTGSALYVNNRGFLAHRDTSAREMKQIEKIFRVKGNTGSVNFGDPFVRSGLVGNKHGMLVGEATSGPEMSMVDDIFVLEG
jgi:translation initiation factor 6